MCNTVVVAIRSLESDADVVSINTRYGISASKLIARARLALTSCSLWQKSEVKTLVKEEGYV